MTARDKVLKIISDLLNTKRPLQSLIKENGMDNSTFCHMVYDDPDLLQIYDRARQFSAETTLDEIIDIADNDPDPAKSRVRVDARKWVMSKLNVKKYGDKMDVNMTQTVDVQVALNEAKMRTVKEITSVQHQQIPKSTQPIDTINLIDSKIPDSKSVEDAEIILVEDILK